MGQKEPNKKDAKEDPDRYIGGSQEAIVYQLPDYIKVVTGKPRKTTS